MNVGRQPIRILIADSQAMFREGLKLLLEAEPDLRIIADTGDADQVPELVSKLEPDILLIDVSRLYSNSGNSDLKLLGQVISKVNNVRSILMTSTIDKNMVFKVLKTGIRGVLPRQSGIALFSKCIRTEMQGGYWISRDIVSDLIANMSPSGSTASKSKHMDCSFSEREEQVLRAVIYGFQQEHSERAGADRAGSKISSHENVSQGRGFQPYAAGPLHPC